MNFLLFLAAEYFCNFNKCFEPDYINLKCTYRRQIASFATGDTASRKVVLFQIFFNLLKQIIELVLGHSKILIKFYFVISYFFVQGPVFPFRFCF